MLFGCDGVLVNRRVDRKVGPGTMAKVLLQATITDVPDDWNVGRFSLLADELLRAGHDMTSRNRDAGKARSPDGRSTSQCASTAKRRETTGSWVAPWRARRSAISPT